MKWIYSSGGHFIFTDKETAERWEGPEGLSLERGLGLFPEIFSSDYEVAHHSLQGNDDYVDLLGKKIESALIICGAQEHLGFLKINDGEYFLIKVEASSGDKELENCVKKIASESFVCDEKINIKFHAKSSSMFLLDTGFSLADAKQMDNEIEVSITEGDYSVELMRYEDDKIWLWVIRLKWTGIYD